jgi:hypothetical protein
MFGSCVTRLKKTLISSLHWSEFGILEDVHLRSKPRL